MPNKPPHFATSLAAALLLLSPLTPAHNPPPAPIAAKTIGVAAFNMAWAGSVDDFKRHLAVCSATEVNWCETRTRTVRGETTPTAAEQARAKQCQDATQKAAGGPGASMLVAPCNAYRSNAVPRPDPALMREVTAYQQKLASLRATIEGLIEVEGAQVIAFQEVRSSAVIKTVLGKFADRWEVCDAAHDAFQTLAFAWNKSLTAKPGVCETHAPLAILDPPNDPAAFRRVRPGLALTLTIDDAPLTFLNVHLKAGCASVNNSNERFPGRLLTDAAPACEVLNRQVPILENWLKAVALRSPRLVLLGDYNRRIDDEAAMNIATDQVRADGSDPVSPNRVSADGKVSSRYLWQEISDGAPTLHQVPLSTKDGGCSGFQGLDHIVISETLKKLNTGTIVSRKIGVVNAPQQSIETSDHCPRIAHLVF